MFITGFSCAIAVILMVFPRRVISNLAFEFSGEGYLSNVLLEVQVQSAFQCAHRCSAIDGCCSYSVCAQCKLCRIHDQNSGQDGAILRIQKGWQHYEISTVRNTLF